MARLSEVGVGDVEVACYLGLMPGRRFLVFYSYDDVWHEAMIALIVGGEEAYILVGGLEHVLFFHILGIIIPTDELIFFQRGRYTTNQQGFMQ